MPYIFLGRKVCKRIINKQQKCKQRYAFFPKNNIYRKKKRNSVCVYTRSLCVYRCYIPLCAVRIHFHGVYLHLKKNCIKAFPQDTNLCIIHSHKYRECNNFLFFLLRRVFFSLSALC